MKKREKAKRMFLFWTSGIVSYSTFFKLCIQCLTAGIILIFICFNIGCISELNKRERSNHIKALALKDKLVEDLSVNSALPISWNLINFEIRMYMDRNYVYLKVPPELRGHLALKTANSDKNYFQNSIPYITFKLKEDAKIYVIYSDINTDLDIKWLNEENGWIKEDLQIETSQWRYQSTRLIKSRSFSKGDAVELWGNGCLSKNCGNYTIVIIPAIH